MTGTRIVPSFQASAQSGARVVSRKLLAVCRTTVTGRPGSKPRRFSYSSQAASRTRRTARPSGSSEAPSYRIRNRALETEAGEVPSAFELPADARHVGGFQREAVSLAGAREVAPFRQHVAQDLERARAARLELEGAAGGVAGSIHVAEGELRGGECLQGGHRARVAEEREAGEAQGLRCVPGGEPLAALAHVGVLQGRAVGRVDARDERAGHRVHRALPPVAQLLALEPGEVGLDHATALQDDGVGAHGPRARERHEDRGQEDPARHDQGSSSPRGATRGAMPPCRKYEGTVERAASAAGRPS